tara:strand:+ start:1833 stop:2105 length:273 start_codon:yes stop_codon:yes gene_type:complete
MEKEDVMPDIQKAIEKTTPTKEWLVSYVGDVLKPENDEVTVEMIIEVMAKEFPEFLLPVAEENFIRGYKQAFVDIGSADMATANNKKQND